MGQASLSKRSLNLYSHEPADNKLSEAEQEQDQARFDAAVKALQSSESFKAVYESRILPLLSMPQSRIISVLTGSCENWFWQAS